LPLSCDSNSSKLKLSRSFIISFIGWLLSINWLSESSFCLNYFVFCILIINSRSSLRRAMSARDTTRLFGVGLLTFDDLDLIAVSGMFSYDKDKLSELYLSCITYLALSLITVFIPFIRAGTGDLVGERLMFKVSLLFNLFD
jgi:hypothetical protein